VRDKDERRRKKEKQHENKSNECLLAWLGGLFLVFFHLINVIRACVRMCYARKSRENKPINNQTQKTTTTVTDKEDPTGSKTKGLSE